MTSKTAAILQLVTAAGIVVFWVLFLGGMMTLPDQSDLFLAHEHGFIVPDLALAAVMVFAAVALLRGSGRGRVPSLVAAGGLAFLALYDFGWEFAVAFHRTPLDRVFTTVMDLWLLALAVVLVWVFGTRA